MDWVGSEEVAAVEEHSGTAGWPWDCFELVAAVVVAIAV